MEIAILAVLLIVVGVDYAMTYKINRTMDAIQKLIEKYKDKK